MTNQIQTQISPPLENAVFAGSPKEILPELVQESRRAGNAFKTLEAAPAKWEEVILWIFMAGAFMLCVIGVYLLWAILCRPSP